MLVANGFQSNSHPEMLQSPLYSISSHPLHICRVPEHIPNVTYIFLGPLPSSLLFEKRSCSILSFASRVAVLSYNWPLKLFPLNPPILGSLLSDSHRICLLATERNAVLRRHGAPSSWARRALDGTRLVKDMARSGVCGSSNV